MIGVIFIVIALLTAWADHRAYRKVSASKLWQRIIYATTLTLLNILPLILLSITAVAPDNSQTIMSIASWALTIYTIATLVRMSFYLGFLTIKPKKLALIVGGIFATIVFATLCNSLINTRTNLKIKRVAIKHATIPKSFDGFRIALFSDLHIASLISPEREITRLAESINKQDVDMVIFAGDLLHIRHTELSAKIASILSTIKARYGVYTVLGNHDTGVYIKDTLSLTKNENIAHLNTKIGQIGWTMLRDSTIYAVRGRDSIAVTGIDFTDALLEYKHSFATPDNYSAESLFSSIPKEMFNIAVSHLPQLWHPISSGNFAELTLSGHIHATQVAVEMFGKRVSPAMLMYKEWSGLYSKDNNHLYITDGIGSVGFYLRIGARPELTIIELNR
ncbi:MAG: metallophosphoesterase family protein [Alistipes sp.]|nr:metallophosphoesterase family protein [Alistipes sp.]